MSFVRISLYKSKSYAPPPKKKKNLTSPKNAPSKISKDLDTLELRKVAVLKMTCLQTNELPINSTHAPTFRSYLERECELIMTIINPYFLRSKINIFEIDIF